MQKLYLFLHFTYHIDLIILLLYQSYLFTDKISNFFKVLEVIFQVDLVIKLDNSALLKDYIV